MQKNECDFLCAALTHCGIEHSVQPNYSGRGMYGKQTYAIVLDDPMDLLSAVVDYIIDTDPEDIVRIPGFSRDSMGKNSVVIY
jgi:hypothetical protein